MSTRAKGGGPDQLDGWLIAMACFFINFICAGLARTAGVLYVALIELYGVSREEATTPFSIRVCVRNMTGPLIGLLGLRYGIRGVTIFGGFVAALGSALCYFAPNVTWITVYWGVIHGCGFGLSTVLHMMMIGQYFDKYKASALGLGYSGDCFGTFAFPVIMEHLLATYDVQGTFLILGGIVLHVVPLAMLLKKPPWLSDKRRTASNIAAATSNNQRDVAHQNEAFVHSREDVRSVECHGDKPGFEEDQPPVYREAVLTDRRVNCLRYESSSVSGSPRSCGNRSEVSDSICENTERHDSLPPVLETADGNDSFSVSEDVPPIDGRRSGTVSRCRSESTRKPRTPSFMGQMAHDIVHRMRTASFASQVAQDGFICNLQQDREEEPPACPQQDLYIPKDSPENGRFKTCSLDIQQLEADLKQPSPPSATTKDISIFRTLVDTNTKPMFVLICLTMAVFAFLFVGVLTIIIDYATDQGVSPERGKYLIIGFSVADLVGRLNFGQLIDRGWVEMRSYAGTTTLLMGLLVGVIPLNRSYHYMMACMCMYGLVQGGVAIMFPILIGCYMERHEESVAMGCLNFYGGLLMLCLAPMIGFFRDQAGSYDGVFFILGGLVVGVAAAWLLEPLLLKCQRRRAAHRYYYAPAPER